MRLDDVDENKLTPPRRKRQAGKRGAGGAVWAFEQHRFEAIIRESRTQRAALKALGCPVGGGTAAALQARCDDLGLPRPAQTLDAKRYAVTEGDLLKAVRESDTRREVALKLGLGEGSKTCRWLRERLERLGIRNVRVYGRDPLHPRRDCGLYRVPEAEFRQAVSAATSGADALRRLGVTVQPRNYQFLEARCKELEVRVARSSSLRRANLTDQEIRAAVASTSGRRRALLKLGISEGNVSWIHERVAELGIDVSHWKTRKSPARKSSWIRPLDEYLVEGSYASSSYLRKRLIKEKVLAETCTECGLGAQWEGRSLTLHLDHISGDRTDNRLANLRFLCPNCHSQTETYCGNKRPARLRERADPDAVY